MEISILLNEFNIRKGAFYEIDKFEKNNKKTFKNNARRENKEK